MKAKHWISVIGMAAILILLAFGLRSLLRTDLFTVLRVRHALSRAGFSNSVQVSKSRRAIVLGGRTSTKERYIEASETAAAIVGQGHVVNNLIIDERIRRNPNDRLGVLDIAIDTLYDDSPQSLKEVSAIVRLPQFEELQVAASTTLRQLIFDRYGFGPEDLPSSYSLVAQSILKRNNLVSHETLEAGKLKAPILPKRTPIFDHTPPAPVPQPQTGIISYGAMYAYSDTETGLQQLSKATSIGSTQYVLQVPVTRETLAQTKMVASDLPLDILSSKVKIDFAAGVKVISSHSVLDNQDRTAIGTALKRPSMRTPTLFILDSGWPDAGTYASSLAELHRLVNVATDYYGLPREDQADKPFVPLPQTPGSQHAVEIRDSLKEFADQDTRHVVKIVYVPLTLDQGSSAILSQLLKLYYIRKLVKERRQVENVILQGAMGFAAQSLHSNIAPQTTGNSVETEAALLEAVWSLADLAASRDPQRGVFFINESWTVESDTRQDSHSGISSGVSVAAVGNTPGRVVNSEIGYFDFAGQCATTKSVIAVLDVKPGAGLVCKSSELDDSLIDDSFAASFDGEVNDSLCGSSFSAPRLAWVLALGEAIRSQDIEATKWVIYLQHKLTNSRRPSSDPWEHIYAHPADLLGDKSHTP